MTFNQKEYINQYKKEHYSKLSVDLPKNIKQELTELCKSKGITMKQFIIEAMKQFKK